MKLSTLGGLKVEGRFWWPGGGISLELLESSKFSSFIDEHLCSNSLRQCSVHNAVISGLGI